MLRQGQSRNSKVSRPGSMGQLPNTVVLPISNSIPRSDSQLRKPGRDSSIPAGPPNAGNLKGLQVPLKGNSTDLKNVPESKKSWARAL